MTPKSKFSAVVFTMYIVICFYVFGGSMVNALVGYQTWKYVGPEEFARFHQADATFIIPVFVIFFFLSFIPQLLLFWYRPAAVPVKLVAAAFLLNLVNLISTVTIQIPIQAELDKGFSQELLMRLISTDFIYRRTTISLIAILNSIMLYKVVYAALKK